MICFHVALDVVTEQQNQITWLGHLQGAPVASCSSGITSIWSAEIPTSSSLFLQHARQLRPGRGHAVVIAAANEMIEMPGGNFGDIADVFIATIAGRGQHDDALAVRHRSDRPGRTWP